MDQAGYDAECLIKQSDELSNIFKTKQSLTVVFLALNTVVWQLTAPKEELPKGRSKWHKSFYTLAWIVLITSSISSVVVPLMSDKVRLHILSVLKVNANDLVGQSEDQDQNGVLTSLEAIKTEIKNMKTSTEEATKAFKKLAELLVQEELSRQQKLEEIIKAFK
ncbi:hypothetical protein L486_07462 [Kwoniella mangroviensis CBS 10435]|uniref:Uncharacterized protein n=1 Tax=Kwoniella mangroviensis CBS 10435 TaxID=1331196 RepID=A0A1B9IH92_9TREE|nr:hypothetical protein L486_07462 [Kwoniella mangroviensis CBS 10435]